MQPSSREDGSEEENDTVVGGGHVYKDKKRQDGKKKEGEKVISWELKRMAAAAGLIAPVKLGVFL